MSDSVTLWTVSRQAPLSMGFPRQDYWSGLPCPPPGGLPDQQLLCLLHWQVDSLTLVRPGKPHSNTSIFKILNFFSIDTCYSCYFLKPRGFKCHMYATRTQVCISRLLPPPWTSDSGVYLSTWHLLCDVYCASQLDYIQYRGPNLGMEDCLSQSAPFHWMAVQFLGPQNVESYLMTCSVSFSLSLSLTSK